MLVFLMLLAVKNQNIGQSSYKTITIFEYKIIEKQNPQVN